MTLVPLNESIASDVGQHLDVMVQWLLNSPTAKSYRIQRWTLDVSGAASAVVTPAFPCTCALMGSRCVLHAPRDLADTYVAEDPLERPGTGTGTGGREGGTVAHRAAHRVVAVVGV